MGKKMMPWRKAALKREAKEWGMAMLKVGALTVGYSAAAYAIPGLTGSNSSDPLGGPMCKGVQMFTGKWAFALVVLGLVGIGATVAWGSEMNEILKKVVTWIFAGILVSGGTGVVTYLFGFTVSC